MQLYGIFTQNIIFLCPFELFIGLYFTILSNPFSLSLSFPALMAFIKQVIEILFALFWSPKLRLYTFKIWGYKFYFK